MTSREYIINRLNQLSTIFPTIKFRYEISKSTGCHIIEVTHRLNEDESEAYLKTEMRLDMDFATNYPAEDILFVTEESLTKIHNAELVIEGNKKGLDISPAKPITVSGFDALMDLDHDYLALAA